MTYRIFVSAVTRELGDQRTAVARVLRRKELEVRDQAHFRQGEGTLLQRLRDYIRDCDAVVLLVGHSPGTTESFPTPDEVRGLGAMRTYEDYLNRTGQACASYTQWEYMLAKEYGRDTYVFMVPNASWSPENVPAGEEAAWETQQAFRGWMATLGEHYDALTTEAKLIEDVLVLPFPDGGTPKPITLEPPLGSLFKGREEALSQLRDALHRRHDNRATAIVGRALHGLGGVGKTRLANEFGWMHQDDYTALFFIQADSPANLRENIANLVGALVLNLPEQDIPEEEVRLGAALRWLQKHPRWFMILDNVDTEEAARAAQEMLSKLHGGHVLITSRIEHWGAGIEAIELDVLCQEAATEFLLERTDSRRKKAPSDQDDATELAGELDGLALALEQAGAYIYHLRLSFQDYLAKWRQQLSKVIEWHHEREMNYPRSLAVTWQTTMEQLGAGEVALLRLFSCFAADPIPLFVIDSEEAASIWREAVDRLINDEEIPAGHASDPREALTELATYSMLRWDGGAETATVHRVVQQTVRARIPESHSTAWLGASMALLKASLPSENPEDVRSWPRWTPLAPHVAYLVRAEDISGVEETAAFLMDSLGRLRRAEERWVETEPLFRRSLELREARYGPDHPEVAPSLNNLASLLSDTNRYAEAEPLLRRSLTIIEASLGTEHPVVAKCLNNLALLLERTNRHFDAEPLFRRSLEISEKSFGPEHSEVATSLNNLALLLTDTNRFAEAEPLFRRSLKIDEENHGADHPLVAISLNSLASLLQETNRFAEAEPLFRRSLEISEKCYGPEHSRVATSLNSLASLLQETNRFAEAEPLFRRSLEIKEKIYGPEHPEVAKSLNNLALLLHETNRFVEAEPLFRRSLAISEASYGLEHPDVASKLNNLAELLHDTNRAVEAEPLLRRSLKIVEASYGPDHPLVATSLNNLAGLLEGTNRDLEAEPLYRRSLKIREASYGPEHPEVARSLHNLAILEFALGRPRQALVTSRKAVRILLGASAAARHDLGGLRNLITIYEEIMQRNGIGPGARRTRLEKLYKECGWRPQDEIDPA